MKKESAQAQWYKKWWGVILLILVWPIALAWYIWAKTNWKKENKWIATGAIAVILIIASIVAGSSSEKDKGTTKNVSVETSQTKETPKQVEKAQPAAAVAYAEAASYTKSGENWKLIVFSTKPTTDELKKTASELHSKDKTARYHLFDSNEKIEEYKNWDINYGKVFDRDGVAKQITDCSNTNYCLSLVKAGNYAFKAPEEWMNVHELGLINQMLGETNWQLSTPIGEKISDL